MEEPYVDSTSLPMLHPFRRNGAKWFKHRTEVPTGVRKAIKVVSKDHGAIGKKCHLTINKHGSLCLRKKLNWDASINYQVEEANNEDFSFIIVMKKVHQKPDGTYLESSGEENVTAENLDQREKNEIYLKAAAGSSKQGHVFGLGALRNEVLPAFKASSTVQQPSEEPEMITQRLQEVEAELKQNREEKLEFQRRFESMEKIVQSLASHNA
ncbi:unnamed protein product [Arabis nemorensis]|uniref:Uncharacterized protein n=1 Tax=Arabis nemorensis TaxID=586526 RepID=A0A565BHL6_9BRAS|nr:unnamed protein product [Arabis nemorensis]